MIRYFATHPTAANLMMIALIVVGLVSLPGLQRETFPRIEPRRVQISVAYPGAAPQEVARAICQRIEDAAESVQDVEEIVCVAREGVGVATVEMIQGRDLDRFRSDLRAEIDAIADFPDTAEEPVITQLGRTDFVASVAVTGPQDRDQLRTLAEGIKDRMLRLGGMREVEIKGFSDRRIRIEMADAAARQLGLGLDDIARTVTRRNLDAPVGEVETRDGVILLRVTDERTRPEAFADLVVASSPAGGVVRLGDIARIERAFERRETRVTLNGAPAALLDISKTPGEDTLRIMEDLRAFLEAERDRLPPEVTLTVTGDGTEILRSRLEMVLSNAGQGLALVFAAMWLFFGLRQAFWIGLGLPISFLGALAAMAALGYSINMLTMVGLLIVIGILMDDAIVIAENIATKREQGLEPLEAAIQGARQVAPGVMSSFATTAAVFGPLGFLQGDLGEVLRVVPIVMLLVLSVSLVEAFLILPHHLVHSAPGRPSAATRRAEAWLDAVRRRAVGPAADWSVRWRYLTLGLGVMLFLAAVSAIAGGVVKFQAFPEIDGDRIEARIELSAAARLEDTEAAVAHVLAGLEQVNRRLGAGNEGDRELVQEVVTSWGENPDAGASGAHLATVSVDLLSGPLRAASNAEILAAWREAAPATPRMRRLNITESQIGPAGRAIELRLRGDDYDRLAAAAEELKAWLARYEGVHSLADDLAPGKPELRLTLKPEADALGVDARLLTDQLRAAFQGMVADEVQAGGENWEVALRLRLADRDSLGDLDSFAVRTPSGERAPLSAVAEIEPGRGYARLARVDGLPTVTVTGDVDTAVANANEVVSDTQVRFFPELLARHPGVRADTEGQNAAAARTQASMLSGLLVGLVGVFLALSFTFRSYAEPVVVMMLIPFALIGAVAGHLALGVDLSMPSMLGMVSLAGIVVNDSILLVNVLKDEHEPGVVTVAQAAPKAAEARFRAIVLTSMTTILGLLPLLFETSLQAQLLIPLVVSIAFGLASSTLLILLVVPAFYAVLDDFGLTSLAAERRALARAEAEGAG
ncbi:MAG: efflux RND transporter permease subunit [Pseudomonadota bacterium]